MFAKKAGTKSLPFFVRDSFLLRIDSRAKFYHKVRARDLICLKLILQIFFCFFNVDFANIPMVATGKSFAASLVPRLFSQFPNQE